MALKPALEKVQGVYLFVYLTKLKAHQIVILFFFWPVHPAHLVDFFLAWLIFPPCFKINHSQKKEEKKTPEPHHLRRFDQSYDLTH